MEKEVHKNESVLKNHHRCEEKTIKSTAEKPGNYSHKFY
jgi:hypothetical protein